GLEKNTGDARRTLYERARTALVAQLRSVTPALSESDVTRERLALEEAVRKVEAEAARQNWVDRRDPAHKVRPPEMPRWEEPLAAPGPDPSAASLRRGGPVQPRSDPARRSPAPRAANGPAPNSMFGGERYVDPMFDRPVPDAPPAPSAPQSQRHP